MTKEQRTLGATARLLAEALEDERTFEMIHYKKLLEVLRDRIEAEIRDINLHEERY